MEVPGLHRSVIFHPGALCGLVDQIFNIFNFLVIFLGPRHIFGIGQKSGGNRVLGGFPVSAISFGGCLGVFGLSGVANHSRLLCVARWAKIAVFFFFWVIFGLLASPL
jgi:hypothetical protein